MDTGSTVAAVVIGGFVLSPAAFAQSPQSADPAPSSPSGQVYEIPVDAARTQGAPTRKPDGSSLPAAAPTSSIHSDNGFGTSSEVPASESPPESPPESSSDASAQSSNDRPHRTPKARKRPGMIPVEPGSSLSEEAKDGARSSAAVPDEPSSVQAGLLIGLATLLAGGLGFAGWRDRRGPG